MTDESIDYHNLLQQYWYGVKLTICSLTQKCILT